MQTQDIFLYMFIYIFDAYSIYIYIYIYIYPYQLLRNKYRKIRLSVFCVLLITHVALYVAYTLLLGFYRYYRFPNATQRDHNCIDIFLQILVIISFRVDRWADKLGTELWELANEIAQPEELLEVSIYLFKIMTLYFI